tara:strand:- start:46 stop:177 length:132 start_codon:yes stop_codon:yes gene_type:complete
VPVFGQAAWMMKVAEIARAGGRPVAEKYQPAAKAEEVELHGRS